MQEDYKWFLEQYSVLYEKYGEAYLAIKNKKVLGVCNTYADGVRATSRNEELGTFIIQKYGKDESSHTNYIASMNFRFVIAFMKKLTMYALKIMLFSKEKSRKRHNCVTGLKLRKRFRKVEISCLMFLF